MILRLSITILFLCIFPGCGLIGKKKPASIPVDDATRRPVMGTIAMVNEPGRFVLIETNRELRTGTALYAGADTAEPIAVRVSTERRRPFVVAEILTGTPLTGMQLTE